jgi:hypothetical protein
MRLALICALLVPLATAETKGVSWTLIDPFCGQISSSEPEAYPIKTATIRLYRAKAKHLPCCGSAVRLADVPVKENGNFDLRELPAGQYWMVASWGDTEVHVALWADRKHNYACSDQFKNIIKINPRTGTAERTVITSVE